MPHVRRFAGSLLLVAVVALVVPIAIARAQRPNSTAEPRALNGPPNEQPLQRKPSRLTETQLENMAARIATATAIVTRFEREAKARGLSSGWRQATLDSLLALSLPALHRVESQAFSADALLPAIANAADDAQLIGDVDKDLLYFPIAPCRFVDTRAVGGQITGTRGYDIANNGATYGGSAGCAPTSLFGAPENAFGALVLNVTIVDPTVAPGFLAIKPTAAAPATSLINWYEGGSVQLANQGIVTLDQSALVDEFVVQTGNVHVILDIFGAFLAPHATALDAQTVETNFLITASSSFSESAACPAGYSLTGGGYTYFGPSTNIWVWQSGPDGTETAWACRGFNDTASLVDFTCSARCARVPGR